MRSWQVKRTLRNASGNKNKDKECTKMLDIEQTPRPLLGSRSRAHAMSATCKCLARASTGCKSTLPGTAVTSLPARGNDASNSPKADKHGVVHAMICCLICASLQRRPAKRSSAIPNSQAKRLARRCRAAQHQLADQRGRTARMTRSNASRAQGKRRLQEHHGQPLTQPTTTDRPKLKKTLPQAEISRNL